MNLRELFENKGITIGVCFGRWNPPHKGHKAAWEIAATFDIFYVGTNKNTEGPNDPLPYSVKLKCMETIWPEIAGHVIPEQSLFTLASKVFAKHGENSHLKVATDEDWLTKSLMQYNGKEGAHGYYKFASIEQVPTPRLSSATALRAAVRANDRDGFSDAAGVDADTPIKIGEKTVQFFDLVAHYLAKHPEKAKRAVKAKEDAAGVGTITNQNSTIDVNKHTPAKNLQAFNLIKETNQKIRERKRARDFLAELSDNPGGRMNKQAADTSQGHILMRDVGGYDRTYHLNRIMMATAMADGKSKKAVDMDHSSFVQKYNVAFPYTDEEQMMMYQAMATIPTDSGELEKRAKSIEPKDTNVTSTVAKPKRNKYGI
jgi:hypothetical protein